MQRNARRGDRPVADAMALSPMPWVGDTVLPNSQSGSAYGCDASCAAHGIDFKERLKIMKLLRDAIGTEFGGRHELYEYNYAGNHEDTRIHAMLNVE
jgi:4-hydroxyphenylacetate 3-monooxygenase